MRNNNYICGSVMLVMVGDDVHEINHPGRVQDSGLR